MSTAGFDLEEIRLRGKASIMAPARRPTRRNETAEEIACKLFVRNLPRKLNEVSASGIRVRFH